MPKFRAVLDVIQQQNYKETEALRADSAIAQATYDAQLAAMQRDTDEKTESFKAKLVSTKRAMETALDKVTNLCSALRTLREQKHREMESLRAEVTSAIEAYNVERREAACQQAELSNEITVLENTRLQGIEDSERLRKELGSLREMEKTAADTQKTVADNLRAQINILTGNNGTLHVTQESIRSHSTITSSRIPTSTAVNNLPEGLPSTTLQRAKIPGPKRTLEEPGTRLHGQKRVQTTHGSADS